MHPSLGVSAKLVASVRERNREWWTNRPAKDLNCTDVVLSAAFRVILSYLVLKIGPTRTVDKVRLFEAAGNINQDTTDKVFAV